jgi:hypothetical protein
VTDDEAVSAITVDLAGNRLTLHLDAAPAIHPGGLPNERVESAPHLRPRSTIATLEVGTGGRLLGIDVDGRYLTVSEPALADLALARSIAAPVTLHFTADGSLAALDIPRRGNGYEITYPSGNR